MKDKETVGILVTGEPPDHLQSRFGTYDTMLRRMLGPGFAFRTFDVRSGELPEPVDACAAYVITGSPASAYDALPWIPPLEAFLVEVRGRAKLVGICFGHQVMAQAFGGVVARSDKGWGLGLHDYGIADAWSSELGNRVVVPASHRDQVVDLPPDTRIVGGSAFTPHALLAYGDGHSISLQCHPEFDPAFAIELLATNTDDAIPDRVRAEALTSLARADDRHRLAAWITTFLNAESSRHQPDG